MSGSPLFRLVAVAVLDTTTELVAIGSTAAVSVGVCDMSAGGRGVTAISCALPGTVVECNPMTPTEKATTQNATATSWPSDRIGIIGISIQQSNGGVSEKRYNHDFRSIFENKEKSPQWVLKS